MRVAGFSCFKDAVAADASHLRDYGALAGVKAHAAFSVQLHACFALTRRVALFSAVEDTIAAECLGGRRDAHDGALAGVHACAGRPVGCGAGAGLARRITGFSSVNNSITTGDGLRRGFGGDDWRFFRRKICWLFRRRSTHDGALARVEAGTFLSVELGACRALARRVALFIGINDAIAAEFGAGAQSS